MSAAPDEIYRPLNRLLKLAVIGGVEAAVQLHVDRGDDLNARDDHGLTPLMLAASRNRARICRVLIEAGADLSARDGAGTDALSIARAGGAAECAAEIEAAMRVRAESCAPRPEPDGWLAVPGTGDEGPTIGGEAPTDAYPPPDTSVLPPGREVACGIEPYSLAGLARVAAPTLDTVANARDADEPAFAIDDDKTPFDVSVWEGESESPPPEGDASLGAAPTAIHRAISLHEPIDDSADWSDFEAFLPEYAAPLPRFDNAEVRAELRALLLRALREGSVPSQAVDDLDDVSLGSGADPGTSPLRYVIEDLGAETDERFEYRAPHESFEVHVEPAESADEEQAVDEALAFLDDLQSRRNDPMRLYMREAQRRPLIGAEEESILAKTMEDSSKQAIDSLVGWPLGIARVFEEVEKVRAGTRPVSSMIAVQREDADAGSPSTDEESDMIVPAADSEPAPELSGGGGGGGGEISDPDEAVGASLFEKAVSLRALVDTAQADDSARRQISTTLHALSLSRPFLLRLADTGPDDNSEGARRFRAAARRLAAARDRMAGANLRLVLSLAKRYLFSGIPMDDLIQEGNIGLIKAVDKFDWRRGFKFSTMATWWIRQQLSRSVADAALAIRLPVHFRDDVLLIERETRELEKSLGRSPSTEQLAARLGMKHGKVAMLLRAVSTPLSIDELEAELESIGSVGPDPFDALDAIQLGKALAVSLDALDSKQAKIIRLRFGIGVGEPCTLEEVGQLFEVTRERIRQIEAKAMRRLMNPGRLDMLRPWLDRGAEDKTSKPTQKSDAAKSEGSRGRARDEPKQSESSDAEPPEAPVPETAVSAGPEDPAALDRLLVRASEMGIVVEHTGDGISRATWVNVDEARDNQTRGLVRRLLAMGFMHWPGKGYWK